MICQPAGWNLHVPSSEIEKARGRLSIDAIASKHRANSGEKLARVERLDHVIVGADFQAENAINVLPFRRQHNDGDCHRATQPHADRKTVLGWKVYVEHDEFEGALLKEGIDITAVKSLCYVEAALDEISSDKVADLSVVFDDQYLRLAAVHFMAKLFHPVARS
jgi:hypothetical protein